MRAAFWCAVLLLAACSAGEGEASVTTATPTTTAAITTTTAAPGSTPPATQAQVECTDQGGVSATERGFVCPPDLRVADRELVDSPYLPGTYQTRLFEPRFEFSRSERFRSTGEFPFLVQLDIEFTGEGPRQMYAFAPAVAVALDPATLEAFDWTRSFTVGELELLDSPGTWIQFVTEGCPCLLPLPLLDDWGWGDEWTVALIRVEVPEGPIGFQISAHRSIFSEYVEQTALPILDSITLLD